MSCSVDRIGQARLVVHSVSGEVKGKKEWERRKSSVPGVMISDAASIFKVETYVSRRDPGFT